jgi:hypothetical protein
MKRINNYLTSQALIIYMKAYKNIMFSQWIHESSIKTQWERNKLKKLSMKIHE